MTTPLKSNACLKIGIVNNPDATRLDKQIRAIIAGSAPTAHLIGELEKKNIHVVHVYGLTYVLASSSINDKLTVLR